MVIYVVNTHRADTVIRDKPPRSMLKACTCSIVIVFTVRKIAAIAAHGRLEASLSQSSSSLTPYALASFSHPFITSICCCFIERSDPKHDIKRNGYCSFRCDRNSNVRIRLLLGNGTHLSQEIWPSCELRQRGRS